MKKEDLQKFYLTYRLYIFPVVVTFSCLVLIILVIYPETVKLIINQKTQEEVLNKHKFLEVKAQTLANFDSEDLNKKLNYVLSSYPGEKDFISAMSLLQNIATQLGFSVVSIHLGTGAAKADKGQSFSLRLEVLGPTNFLPTLLNRIENATRIMKISSVDTNSGKESQSGTTTINIDTLYAAVPSSGGTVDSPLPELSQKDEEILVKLARVGTPQSTQATSQLGPRGKANPFE